MRNIKLSFELEVYLDIYQGCKQWFRSSLLYMEPRHIWALVSHMIAPSFLIHLHIAEYKNAKWTTATTHHLKHNVK